MAGDESPSSRGWWLEPQIEPAHHSLLQARRCRQDLRHKDKEPTHHRPNHLPLRPGSRTSRQVCPRHSSPSRRGPQSPLLTSYAAPPLAVSRRALRRSARRKRWPQGHPPTIRSAAADRFHAGGMPLTSLWWRPMGATLARSAAIGQRAIAISAGPPLRRGALRGAHGNPGRARALAWNRVCGAIGFEFSDARAVELKCADLLLRRI